MGHQGKLPGIRLRGSHQGHKQTSVAKCSTHSTKPQAPNGRPSSNLCSELRPKGNNLWRGKRIFHSATSAPCFQNYVLGVHKTGPLGCCRPEKFLLAAPHVTNRRSIAKKAFGPWSAHPKVSLKKISVTTRAVDISLFHGS